MSTLENTVAIVTGASRGIGAAIAKRLNVRGLLLVSKEAARHFGPASGSIVNISSVASTRTPPTSSVYSATKAAVAGMAESYFRKQVEAQTPLGRIGQPEDIAPAVAFLASPDAAWITGETLLVAGGLR